MPMLMSADNPVGNIVKAVVLGAKILLSRVPLVLICVPKGIVWFGLCEGGIAASVVV